MALRATQKQEPREEIAQHLRKVSLFEDIVGISGALESLAEEVEIRSYRAGESIIREGDQGSEMFILIEGNASVYKSTPEVERYKVALLKGEFRAFFGEGGLLDSDARSATIVTDSASQCIVLDRAHYEHFGKVHPELAFPIALRIARVVLKRLSKTNTDLMLLYNALVEEIRG